MKLITFLLLSIFISCSKGDFKKEILPEEVVTEVETKTDTYSKYCLEDSCYCMRDDGRHRAIVVSCFHYEEVRRVYNKLNNIKD